MAQCRHEGESLFFKLKNLKPKEHPVVLGVIGKRDKRNRLIFDKPDHSERGNRTMRDFLLTFSTMRLVQVVPQFFTN